MIFVQRGLKFTAENGSNMGEKFDSPQFPNPIYCSSYLVQIYMERVTFGWSYGRTSTIYLYSYSYVIIINDALYIGGAILLFNNRKLIKIEGVGRVVLYFLHRKVKAIAHGYYIVVWHQFMI